MEFVKVVTLAVAAALAAVGCSSKKEKKYFGQSLQITTTALPDAYEGQTGYNATFTATGGTGSYTWSMVSGFLPPNLNFDSNGLIYGDVGSTTSSASPYSFTVEVTDGQQKA